MNCDNPESKAYVFLIPRATNTSSTLGDLQVLIAELIGSFQLRTFRWTARS